MKISIITPVYKADVFLYRCVDSIIAQTYQDWELFLVDDGSPDNSGKICDDYAKHDSRIRVIHQENGGVSSARQAGLDAVTGDYVIHVDSDDWVATNWLEELVACVNETHAEMVIYDFFRVKQVDKERVIQKPTSLLYQQVLKDIVSGHLYACCWNKLIKRDKILKNGASFPKGFNFSEDKCFLVSLLSNPITVAYISQPLYYYDVTINTGSLVRQITKSSMSDGFAMVDYLEKKLGNDFKSEIYETKRRLKLRAIESGLYTNAEVNDIYHNLNLHIVKDVIMLKRRQLDDYILFFTTVNAMWLAKLLRKTYLFLYNVKTKLNIIYNDSKA